MRPLSNLSVVALLGLGVAILAPSSSWAAGPGCDDATAVAAYVSSAVAANLAGAAAIASEETARCPADAAVIATAAVNADPNGSQAIVDAVLAALPPDMRDDDVLTTALTELTGQTGRNPPDPDGGVGAPLIAPFTAGPAHFETTASAH